VCSISGGGVAIRSVDRPLACRRSPVSHRMASQGSSASPHRDHLTSPEALRQQPRAIVRTRPARDALEPSHGGREVCHSQPSALICRVPSAYVGSAEIADMERRNARQLHAGLPEAALPLTADTGDDCSHDVSLRPREDSHLGLSIGFENYPLSARHSAKPFGAPRLQPWRCSSAS
jgi:hypothetical protein